MTRPTYMTPRLRSRGLLPWLEEPNDMKTSNAVREAVLSQRATKRITDLYCVVVKDETGMEGIVRRDTPIGTQPWMTDDRKLAADMLVMAKRASGFDGAYLARFKRVKL